MSVGNENKVALLALARVIICLLCKQYTFNGYYLHYRHTLHNITHISGQCCHGNVSSRMYFVLLCETNCTNKVSINVLRFTLSKERKNNPSYLRTYAQILSFCVNLWLKCSKTYYTGSRLQRI